MYQNPGGMSHYSQSPHLSGPPPTKKPRGNTIITRYPPPPGYQPPVQIEQTPTWQQTHGYSNSQASYPGTQQTHMHYPGYSHTQYGFQNHQQQHGAQGHGPQYGTPGYQPQHSSAVYAHQHASSGYPSQVAPSSCSQQVAPSGYQPPQDGQYPALHPSWQHVSTPQSAPAQSWPQSRSGYPPHAFPPNSAPFSSTAGVYDGNGDIMPPIENVGADLEEDFDAECYFARRPDEIQPDLSIGLIEWKAPFRTTRAFPSDYDEAKAEGIDSYMFKASESVSQYFDSAAAREEAFHSIRELDDWAKVKDDLIFREMPIMPQDIIPVSRFLETYRYRYDPAWAEEDEQSPTPELSRESTPARRDSDMEISSECHARDMNRDDGETGALDELEKAIWANNQSSGPASCTGTNSRAQSVSSQHGYTERLSRPKPLPPLHDQLQEERLAALGVTGAPKLVYETPPPAFGPPQTNTNHERRLSGHATWFNGARTNVLPPRPSSSTRQSQPHDSWVQQNSARFRRQSSSANSQHTDEGPGFDNDSDNEPTPRPKLPRTDSRKRSYAEWQADAIAEHPDEWDDTTPRQRRKYTHVVDNPNRGQ